MKKNNNNHNQNDSEILQSKSNVLSNNLFSALFGSSTGGVLQENVFLEISQNSQENIYATVSFLIKLQSLQLY